MSQNKFNMLVDLDNDEYHSLKEKEEPKKFFKLPDHIQMLIFSYLPYRTRLVILTEKYPQTYCYEKLNKLPVNMITYTILHRYAQSVMLMLERIVNKRWYKSYNLIYDCLDWMHNVPELERRWDFTERVLGYENLPVKRLILAAFTHYRKMKSSEKDRVESEAIMIRLYSFVVGIK